MRKLFCVLLVSIILFCGVGCGDRLQFEEPSSAFLLSENRGTAWRKSADIQMGPYFCYEELDVYEGGEATLTHDNVVYRLVETGKTFRLEKDLYASPFDETPAQTLDAGEVRLRGDGAKVRVEVLSDPLGIFAGFAPEELVLPLSEYWHPSRYHPHTPHYTGVAPHFQPGTGWYERAGHRKANGGIVYYTNCNVVTEADGTVRGTVQVTDESQKEDCVLLWAGDAGALVRPDGELLYYGGRMQLSRFERDDCAEYVLKANYDPLHLSVSSMLILYRGTGSTEPRKVIGRSRSEILADFTADGWTYEPLTTKEDEDDDYDYGELFVKLTKDSKMLLIYLDEDIVGRFADEWYALAYVLIGADGKLESWGGQKPGDHTLADGYKLSDPFPFGGGLWGLMEDDEVFLLDDGRILITYVGHESRKVGGFIIFDPRG